MADLLRGITSSVGAKPCGDMCIYKTIKVLVPAVKPFLRCRTVPRTAFRRQCRQPADAAWSQGALTALCRRGCGAAGRYCRTPHAGRNAQLDRGSVLTGSLWAAPEEGIIDTSDDSQNRQNCNNHDCRRYLFLHA